MCPKCPKKAKKPASKKLTEIQKRAYKLLDEWKIHCKATARPEDLNQISCLRWTKLGKGYLGADILDEEKLKRRRVAIPIHGKIGKMICKLKKLVMDKASRLQIDQELSRLYSNRERNIDRIKQANKHRIKAGKKPIPIPELRRCHYVPQQKRYAWLFKRPAPVK